MASDVPVIIRPELTGPELFVGLSGIVNTVWVLIIGVLTLVLIRWQYGSLEARIEPYTQDTS